MANISLLNGTSRVEIPYVKVTIGTYTFGVYQKTKANVRDVDGFFVATRIVYPNYVKSLTVKKINGQVNQYTLNIVYPITQNDDPNFFEKVFSSVQQTRKIVFSYGDMALPTFIYKNEEALITTVTSSFNMQSNTISYTVSAVSSAALAKSGCYTFINNGLKKPSDEIKKLLYNKTYGLQEIFYGMNNKALVEEAGLIASDDKAVKLETKTNISALDYLSYLIRCMLPASSNNKVLQNQFYIMTVVDDTTGKFGGPYFKVNKVSNNIEQSSAYEIDIGYPTANIVKSFNVTNQENYSIFYNFQRALSDNDYVYRLNDNGEYEEIYSPAISSNNPLYKTRTDDKNWWSKASEFPISATITIKGLLRPAILMTYVRLNVLFFGNKHIHSGLYIVTAQQDDISENGYETTLSLTRISGDK